MSSSFNKRFGRSPADFRIRLAGTVGIVLILVLSSPFENAEAASCCGGGFASPTIITGDDLATLGAEFSHAKIATEVSSGGIWQTRSAPESLETIRIQGAHVFLDRFQSGLSLPVVRRTRAGQESTGFGDAAVNFGYETLPEWDYSVWRPRGVSYLTLTIPTGRSIQESTDTLQLDARGRGFWAIGLGTTLTKIFRQLDFVAIVEGHRSFSKELKNSSLEGELVPGYGALLSLGAGLSFGDTRLGAALAFSYEDAIETRGPISSSGAPARFATATLSASEMINEEWAVSLAYSDQTWFGSPTNTSLAKSVSATLQRRFSR